MEDKKLTKSIWGNWWTNFRKWFYPAWLIYETAIRFYEYSLPVHKYFMSQGQSLGITTAQTLGYITSSLTFFTCFFFLTVPGCIALFKYFNNSNTTKNKLESKLKSFF